MLSHCFIPSGQGGAKTGGNPRSEVVHYRGIDAKTPRKAHPRAIRQPPRPQVIRCCGSGGGGSSLVGVACVSFITNVCIIFA